MDFNKMVLLAKNDPVAFEEERKRLINAEISKYPKERQLALCALQSEIDLMRTVLAPEDFNQYMLQRITKNLYSLQQHFLKIINEIDSQQKLARLNERTIIGFMNGKFQNFAK